MSYKTTVMPIFSLPQVLNSPKINLYDSIDEDVLQSYREYSLTVLLYYAMKEAACSEQSARMTAMENASKNAGNQNVIYLYHTVSRISLYDLISTLNDPAAG